jgi:hypothetical protein
MSKRNILIVFIILFGGYVYSQGASPTLSDFLIKKDQPNRIFFKSSKPITGSNFKGFNVVGREISGIKINSNSQEGHYITMSRSFDFWDNVLIEYKEESNIVDKDGNPVANLSLSLVENEIPEPDVQNSRFVSADATGNGDGSSENNAWTLNQASNGAQSGMTIWIKSGDYGSQKLEISVNGTRNQPIKIIGYNQSPGDDPQIEKTLGFQFSANTMPLFHDGDGSALILQKKNYIIVKNLQISNFSERGINLDDSNFIHVENCYIEGGLSGIWSNGRKETNTRAIDNLVLNTSFHGIKLAGEFNRISRNFVASNKVMSMDYYIMINGHETGGYGNIVDSNVVDRFSGDTHKGHGIAFKGGGAGVRYIRSGLIYDNQVFNCRGAIELRHSRVMNNVVKGNTVRGNNAKGIENTMGIKFRDGSNHNTVVGNTIYDVDAIIRFHNAGEDSSADGKKAGFNNIFGSNICYNANYFVLADSGTETYGNHFLLNTVYNVKRFTDITIPFDNSNIFENNIISNCKSIVNKGTFDTNNFFSNSFGPVGKNIINEDPKFRDPSRGDFRLKQNSPMIDRGKPNGNMVPDIEGKPRKANSPDLGAYEYFDDTTGSNEDQADPVEADGGSDQFICLGEEAILTAEGGTTYSWSNGSDNQTIRVSPDKTTTYTVVVGDGNSEDTAEVTVFVTEVKADAGSDKEIKSGEKAVLIASGGDQYEWSNGERGSSITVSPQETRTYTVIVSSNGCVAQDEVTVYVESNDTFEDTNTLSANAGEDQTICVGGKALLSSGSSADSYLWSTGETDRSIEVNPARTTSYTLTISKDGVTATDVVTVVVENCNEEESTEVSLTINSNVYPNPTRDIVNVNLSNIEEAVNMMLTNMNGQVLLSDIWDTNDDYIRKQFDMSAYDRGVYFLHVYNTDQNLVTKIIRQ